MYYQRITRKVSCKEPSLISQSGNFATCIYFMPSQLSYSISEICSTQRSTGPMICKSLRVSSCSLLSRISSITSRSPTLTTSLCCFSMMLLRDGQDLLKQILPRSLELSQERQLLKRVFCTSTAPILRALALNLRVVLLMCRPCSKSDRLRENQALK